MLDLLFTLCTWHALAKLRLHTLSTLQIFKSTTKLLGQKLRHWVKKTCAAFDTQELPKEASARHRRKAAAAAKAGKGKEVPIRGKGGRGRGREKGRMPGQSTRKTTTQQAESSDAHTSKIRKVFNMCTYKIHSLGHYIAAIARFGTTDSYSTQVVNFNFSILIEFTDFPFQGELEHRRVKRFYARTNKRKTFGRQIATQQWRERLLKQIRQQWKEPEREELHAKATQPDSETLHSPAPNVSFEDSDPLPKTLPEVHYHISNTTRLRDNIFRWVDFHEQNDDDAVKVSAFLPRVPLSSSSMLRRPVVMYHGRTQSGQHVTCSFISRLISF